MTSHFIRRALVIAAIVLMSSSALISALLVHANDRHIAMLHKEQDKMDETIRALWDNAGRMDRSVDAAVIVSLLAKNDPTQTALEQYYLARVNSAFGKESFLDDLSRENTAYKNETGATLAMLKAADGERQHTIDAINDAYLKRTEMENDIMKREQANALYANVAFFLQLMSVILVILTRDMPDV